MDWSGATTTSLAIAPRISDLGMSSRSSSTNVSSGISLLNGMLSLDDASFFRKRCVSKGYDVELGSAVWDEAAALFANGVDEIEFGRERRPRVRFDCGSASRMFKYLDS